MRPQKRRARQGGESENGETGTTGHKSCLSAGSQLPLRVLEMYQIVAAGDDSTPLRSEIKL